MMSVMTQMLRVLLSWQDVRSAEPEHIVYMRGFEHRNNAAMMQKTE